MFRRFLGIDIGTSTTQIYLKNTGVVLNEPTMVAFNNRTQRAVAVGAGAKKMMSRTPSHITAVRPMNHGVVADFDMTKEMLQRFLNKSKVPQALITKSIVSVPTNLTEVERKSIEDLLGEVGVSSVDLIEQPLAAAFGSRLEINQPTAFFIVDIGAGTTDMAIISLSGVVVSNRLKIAGNHFNNEIIKGVRDELKLIIGEPTAEEIKITTASVISRGEKLEIAVRGRDAQSGLPKEIIVKDTQVRLWLNRSLKIMVENIKDLIEGAPPELVGDICKNGLFLCGGGGFLRGIDEFIEKEIEAPVKIVSDPLLCVVRGTGFVCENFKTYKHLLNNFSNFPAFDE